MAKIRTTDDLIQSISDALDWRRREIHNISSAFRNGRDAFSPHVRRASVVLAYSHWEGFIKEVCSFYLEFVSRKKLKIKELATCFVALSCMKALKEASLTRSPTPYHQLVDFFRENEDDVSRIPYKDVIDTESNLSSDVLFKLSSALGIQLDDAFVLKKQFIDRNLLRTRHEIAHGEKTEVTPVFAQEICEQVDALMQAFKTSVENTALQQLYRRH